MCTKRKGRRGVRSRKRRTQTHHTSDTHPTYPTIPSSPCVSPDLFPLSSPLCSTSQLPHESHCVLSTTAHSHDTITYSNTQLPQLLSSSVSDNAPTPLQSPFSLLHLSLDNTTSTLPCQPNIDNLHINTYTSPIPQNLYVSDSQYHLTPEHNTCVYHSPSSPNSHINNELMFTVHTAPFNIFDNHTLTPLFKRTRPCKSKRILNNLQRCNVFKTMSTTTTNTNKTLIHTDTTTAITHHTNNFTTTPTHSSFLSCTTYITTPQVIPNTQFTNPVINIQNTTTSSTPTDTIPTYTATSLTSHTSTTSKRKRKRNLKLLKIFPRAIFSITNAGIHNLTLPEYNLCTSPRLLSTLESLVLSLGPQFIPPPSTLTLNDISTICDTYTRTLRLKYFFATNPTYDTPINAMDKLTHTLSTFIPPRACDAVEQYLTHIRTSLSYAVLHPHSQYSSAKQYKTARNYVFHSKRLRKIIVLVIKRLREDHTILFKKCDKNLGLSVIPRQWYEDQALSQLLDINTYTPIPNTSLPTITTIFNKLRTTIQYTSLPPKLQKYIFYTEISCPTPHTTTIPLSKFYLLPKIHKSPISTRPIVACMNSCTYNASKYIDYILQPIMHTIKHILHSNVHLLRHLNITKFPSNCVLLTADVTSLYPSIDLTDGLLKLRQAITIYNTKYNKQIDCDTIVNMCAWVLHNNYFAFGNTVWLQKRGTAMGTPMAVVFANLYLAMLEKSVFTLYHTIHPHTNTNTILLYVRYVDDILACVVSDSHATTLLTLLNHMHHTLTITHTVSDISIDFLDMTIHKGVLFPTTKLLDIKPYQKPMNAYLYIPTFSNHRDTVYKAFIQSEIRRYYLLSTNPTDAISACNRLRTRLLSRGYPISILHNAMNITFNRNQLLFPPHISLLYNPTYTPHNPRSAATYPFYAPPIVSPTQYSEFENLPPIIKLPYTSTFTPTTLRNTLTFTQLPATPHIVQSELFGNYNNYPLICYTRTSNIGDLLISSTHPYDVQLPTIQ